ncbi:MAG: SDR family oxidoreductase [Bacteroidales bacterium]
MRNILITGGASGLGREITLQLLKTDAYRVYFTYSSSKVEAQKIEDLFPNAHAVKCDFTDREEISSLIWEMKEINPNILINNAYCGKFIQNYFHKSDIGMYADSFMLNVIPLLSITKEAVLLFRAKKSGQIITILTEALLNDPIIGASEYMANKAYVEAMCKSWGKENAKYNISSDVIYPSFMKTHFTQDVDERLMAKISTTKETAAKLINMIR